MYECMYVCMYVLIYVCMADESMYTAMDIVARPQMIDWQTGKHIQEFTRPLKN